MIYLHNTTLYTPADVIEHGALVINGETIGAIGHAEDLPCPPGAQAIDLGGMTLIPGFIDLQINGAFGSDFTFEPESIWQVGERLTRTGVTSFLPTIISSPAETIGRAQAVLKEGPPKGYEGASVLGLHLEGPYINPHKSGAHETSHLRLPDPHEYERWSPSRAIRLVTLAPEIPGAIQAIHVLVRNGVTVSAGHSEASFDQALEGIKAGISYGTHLFNAMPPLDHRQPGLVGALLRESRVVAGMIIDGIHVHSAMVSLAWKALGAQRTSLVTDAMAALGMPAGDYQLANRTVHVDGGSARLDDGRLAGSVLSLDQALRNLMAYTGCRLEEALPAVTLVPARLLGLEASLGVLSEGARADLVLLNSERQIAGVWTKGHAVVSPTN